MNYGLRIWPKHVNTLTRNNEFRILNDKKQETSNKKPVTSDTKSIRIHFVSLARMGTNLNSKIKT
jgi:hypothetical protein